ncbi:IS3 family transposase [Clostridium beijerinckii]|uniref:IS3 family transposase n=1 Tax=Clostridium beijerinckii TaxID=1520 RepID=UPI00156F8EC1
MLKCEKYYLHKYNASQKLCKSIDNYISFYNNKRLPPKIKRPKSLRIQGFSRLNYFYYFHCLLDSVQFIFQSVIYFTYSCQKSLCKFYLRAIGIWSSVSHSSSLSLFQIPSI